MARQPTNLLRGTLDLLILKALTQRELHGLGVARRVGELTGGTFEVKPGSLFPALHRIEEAGWLVSKWGQSENNRRAKYYALTTRGRARLKRETRGWAAQASAIARILRASITR